MAQGILRLLLLLSGLWQGVLTENSGYGAEVQRLVKVQEGLCVFVPCTAFYPWDARTASDPVYGYWYQDGADVTIDAPVATNDPHRHVRESTRGRFQLAGDPRAYNCSLSITDAKKEDTGSYFFRVEKGYYTKHSYCEQMLFLMVTALTRTPEIRVPQMLRSGRPGHVICSVPWACEKGTPPHFSWKGAVIRSTARKTPRSPELTFTPQSCDHGSMLTCQVTFPSIGISVETTTRLNVSYAPHSVNLNSFWSNCTAPKAVYNGTSLTALEGQSLRLVCVADGNPPASLSWVWKRRDLSPPRVSASGVLELPSVGAEDGGELTCRAQHPLGSQHLSLNLSVKRSPSFYLCAAEKQESFWPLILTLIRAAAMGAGFLLTYVLTWIYYTRCGHAQNLRRGRRPSPRSS